MVIVCYLPGLRPDAADPEKRKGVTTLFGRGSGMRFWRAGRHFGGSGEVSGGVSGTFLEGLGGSDGILGRPGGPWGGQGAERKGQGGRRVRLESQRETKWSLRGAHRGAQGSQRRLKGGRRLPKGCQKGVQGRRERRQRRHGMRKIGRRAAMAAQMGKCKKPKKTIEKCWFLEGPACPRAHENG